MPSQPIDVDHPDAAVRALDGHGDHAPSELVVTICSTVPDWLPAVIERATEVGVAVAVRLSPDPAIVPPEGRAGWEIGVLTSVLAMGVGRIEGADPKRIRRVQAVIDALAEAATPEDGP